MGLAAHPGNDQFLRLEAGQGRCVMGLSVEHMDFEHDVADGWSMGSPPIPGTTPSTPARSRCGCTPSTHRFTTRPGSPRPPAVTPSATKAARQDEPPSFRQPDDTTPNRQPDTTASPGQVSRCATPSGSPAPAHSPRSAPSATPTPALWPRPSSRCTRPSASASTRSPTSERT